MKISAVISAFNEEKKLEDCLKSVEFADEIIVVDNQSSDNTAKIAQKFTKAVYEKPNNLMLNVNKNYGFSRATGDWILSIDADERVSVALQKEIRRVIAKKEFSGYYIPRRNIIFGKWIEHAGWYPDHQLRLFKKGKGKFEEKHVHEMLKLGGEAGYLKEDLIHLNYDNVSQFLHKTINIYAPNEASELLRKGYVFQFSDVIRFPLREFLSRFFAREGYKDGFHGFMLSLLMGFYHLVVFAFLWERAGYKDLDEKSTIKLIRSEAKESRKQLKSRMDRLTIYLPKGG